MLEISIVLAIISIVIVSITAYMLSSSFKSIKYILEKNIQDSDVPVPNSYGILDTLRPYSGTIQVPNPLPDPPYYPPPPADKLITPQVCEDLGVDEKYLVSKYVELLQVYLKDNMFGNNDSIILGIYNALLMCNNIEVKKYAVAELKKILETGLRGSGERLKFDVATTLHSVFADENK